MVSWASRRFPRRQRRETVADEVHSSPTPLCRAPLLQRDWTELRAGTAPIEQRLQQPLADYWLDRVRIHIDDSYAGVPMMKFPEDLRVYEHLLWESRATAVIEIGTFQGGSALWFRDRLLSFARYRAGGDVRVISVDLDTARARANLAAVDPAYASEIVLIDGDARDPTLVEVVRRQLPPDARCLVVDDSAHTAETTSAALSNFAQFVPLHGYLVVEDGSVDIEAMRVFVDWPRGVLPAIEQWLGSPQGTAFACRRDLERYVVSSHPRGFLQRIAPP